MSAWHSSGINSKIKYYFYRQRIALKILKARMKRRKNKFKWNKEVSGYFFFHEKNKTKHFVFYWKCNGKNFKLLLKIRWLSYLTMYEYVTCIKTYITGRHLFRNTHPGINI